MTTLGTIRGGKGIRAGLGFNGERRPTSPVNKIRANQIPTMQQSGGVVSKGDDNSWDHRDYGERSLVTTMSTRRTIV